MGFGAETKWICVDRASLDLDLSRILCPIALDNIGPDILDSPGSTGRVLPTCLSSHTLHDTCTAPSC
jgi:hypothetical protein